MPSKIKRVDLKQVREMRRLSPTSCLGKKHTVKGDARRRRKRREQGILTPKQTARLKWGPKPPKKRRVSMTETVTVCKLDMMTGRHEYVDTVNTWAKMASVLMDRPATVRNSRLHIMPVTVGTCEQMQRIYMAMYFHERGSDKEDAYETIVYHYRDSEGEDMLMGMPLGSLLLFLYDDRKRTGFGTLTDDDREFLDAHIFEADGHVFLMAEATNGAYDGSELDFELDDERFDYLREDLDAFDEMVKENEE